jgi:acyl-CoA thioesterase-2
MTQPPGGTGPAGDELLNVSAGIAEFLEVISVRHGHGADTFAGKSLSRPAGRVFGGQLLGQAVMAGGLTVPAGRHVHSLHAYFLHPGDPAQPLRYSVHRVRDGGSFSARQVTGWQDDRVIVAVTASFQRAGAGLSHQVPMPSVPSPDGLAAQFPFVSAREAAQSRPAVELRRVFDDAGLPGPEEEHVLSARRGGANGHAGPSRPDMPSPGDGRADAAVWMRFTHELPDDPLLHAAALAYLSDYSILRGALRMHSVRRGSGVRTASLDHSIWFHRPPRLDGWTLYDIFSPATGGMRALGTGRLFDQSGALIASVAQEGLLRHLPPGPCQEERRHVIS